MKRRKTPVIPLTALVLLIGGAMFLNATNNAQVPKAHSHDNESAEEHDHEHEAEMKPTGNETKEVSKEDAQTNVVAALSDDKAATAPKPPPQEQAPAEEGEPMIFNPGVTTASKDGKPEPSQQEKDAAKGNAVMGGWFRDQSVVSKQKTGQ